VDICSMQRAPVYHILVLGPVTAINLESRVSTMIFSICIYGSL